MLSTDVDRRANVGERFRAQTGPFPIVEWWESYRSLLLKKEGSRKPHGQNKLIDDLIGGLRQPILDFRDKRLSDARPNGQILLGGPACVTGQSKHGRIEAVRHYLQRHFVIAVAHDNRPSRVQIGAAEWWPATTQPLHHPDLSYNPT